MIADECIDQDGNYAFLGIFAKFNHIYFTNDDNLQRMVKDLTDEYRMADGKKIMYIDFHVNLRLFIENFISSNYRGFSVSLNSNNWTRMPKRYNPNKVNSRKINEVINFLKDRQYIQVFKGFRGEKRSYNTRILPTEAFISKIKKIKLKKKDLKLHRKRERMVLKDEKKRLIDYKETDSIYNKRSFIIEYEKFLATHDIRLGKDKLQGLEIKRVFNNGKFKHGGRFYATYQSIPSKERVEGLNVNGEKMVELDYSGMHINMLYGRKGLPLYEGDVYTVKGYEKHRALFKIALQIAINAKDAKSATMAMNRQLRINKIPKDLITAKELLEVFAKKHSKISDYFFTGIGVYLQHLDSRICEKVLKKALKANIPVLSVHDSFIIQESKKDLLTRWMKKAGLEVSKVELEIDQK